MWQSNIRVFHIFLNVLKVFKHKSFEILIDIRSVHTVKQHCQICDEKLASAQKLTAIKRLDLYIDKLAAFIQI